MGCLDCLPCLPRRPRHLAPIIKDRIARRYSQTLSVDIHRLLVCPDPSRRLSRSYKTAERLGEGGYGSVFHVQHLPTKEDRAVKVVPKPSEEKKLQRILTEVELLIQLNHPNIMKFHEYFEERTSIYLVTELCTGGDFGRLDVTADGLEEIQLLFREAVGAVAYCHSEGVAHRDLKFENVLLARTDSGRRTAKVIDFGLSAIRQAGETGSEWMDDAVGTHYFAAPEVINGGPGHKYGFECDVWSIGVMLYIVLTEEHPFVRSAQGWSAVLDSILGNALRDGPLDTAGVDAEARQLLERMLEKRPQQRASAREVLEHPGLRSAAAAEGAPVRAVSRGSAETPLPHLKSFLGRVHSFQEYSRLERAIMTLVAYKARSCEVQDLRAAFKAMDPAGAGWLTPAGFGTALAGHGLRLPAEELARLVAALDPDGDGKIQYTDWLAATMKPSAMLSEKAMREVFDFFDIHGTGKVSAADLQEVLGVADVAECFKLQRGATELGWEDFRKLMLQESGKMESLRRRGRGKLRWSLYLGGPS